MYTSSQAILDLEAEIEEVDEAILTHNRIVQKLTMQRYDLISRKLDLEMDETVECAIENDISPRRVMDLIMAELEERNKYAAKPISEAFNRGVSPQGSAENPQA